MKVKVRKGKDVPILYRRKRVEENKKAYNRAKTRREGWERRLQDVVRAAQDKPYKLGENDCFRFACAAVEALTGWALGPAPAQVCWAPEAPRPPFEARRP